MMENRGLGGYQDEARGGANVKVYVNPKNNKEESI
jgi:hypothetical protein